MIRSFFNAGYQSNYEILFATYLTDTNLDTNYKDLYKKYCDFREMLDEVHEYLYPDNKEKEVKAKKYREKVEQQIYPQIKEAILNIMVHSIRIKASNLDYYSNGVFQADKLAMDLEKYIDILDSTLVRNNRFNLIWVDRYQSFNYIGRDDFEKRALEAALSESCIDSNLVPQIIDLYMKNRFKEKKFIEEFPQIMREGRLATLKRVLDNKLSNGKEWKASEYLMMTANIIDKMGIKEDELHFVLDSIILRHLPSNISPKVAKEILGGHLNFFRELYRINQDSINNLHDRKFVRIRENQFIEWRDHVLYYVQYNKETGRLDYTLIPPDAETFCHTSTIQESITTFKTPGDKDTHHILTYDDIYFSGVTIDGKNRDPIKSVESLGNSYLVDAVIHPIIESINQGKYVTKLNDASEEDDIVIEGVNYSAVIPDHSSKIVNFKLFAKDLLELTDLIRGRWKFIPIEIGYRDLFEKEFHCIPSNLEEIQDINRILEEPISKSMLAELLKCMSEVNQERRKYIDSLIPKNIVTFSSRKAQNRYRLSGITKQKKKDRVLLNQMIRAFIQTEAKKVISEPNHNDNFDLREEHIFISGVNYSEIEPDYYFPIANKVDYNTFFELLKRQLGNVPQTKRNEFTKRIINDSTFLWYGGSKNYSALPQSNINKRKQQLINKLIDIFTGYIIGDESVDIKQTEKIEKEFIELSSEAYDIVMEIRRKKDVTFESDLAETTYHTVNATIENPNLSAEQKELLIRTLVENNNKVHRKKKAMIAFMKLALAGDNIPSQEDIERATDLLDLYNQYKAQE